MGVWTKCHSTELEILPRGSVMKPMKLITTPEARSGTAVMSDMLFRLIIILIIDFLFVFLSSWKHTKKMNCHFRKCLNQMGFMLHRRILMQKCRPTRNHYVESLEMNWRLIAWPLRNSTAVSPKSSTTTSILQDEGICRQESKGNHRLFLLRISGTPYRVGRKCGHPYERYFLVLIHNFYYSRYGM